MIINNNYTGVFKYFKNVYSKMVDYFHNFYSKQSLMTDEDKEEVKSVFNQKTKKHFDFEFKDKKMILTRKKRLEEVVKT